MLTALHPSSVSNDALVRNILFVAIVDESFTSSKSTRIAAYMKVE